MICRLYVDNFRCFVNFEIKPESIQLLLGTNGTGKSSVFEVLERLREFVAWGRPTNEIFPLNTLTVWQLRTEQTFELELCGNQGTYKYSLVIEHNRQNSKNRTKREELRFDNNLLYQFDGQDAHLFRDNYSAGPVFPLDWTRSGIATIPEREDNTKLCWFRSRLSRVYYFSIDPYRMEDASIAENPEPSLNLSNLASWYRHLTQDSPEAMAPLFESLGEVIQGFTGMKLSSAGEMARLLRITFRTDEKMADVSEYNLRLSDLSPGQRCLIALFTILHCAVRKDVTLCIDEPDNFVALREIQPWLNELTSRIETKGGQCLLISHHPELIDILAGRYGIQFTRADLGPVRTARFEWSDGDAARPSERIARGWEQ
jgi:predicted ATPase